MQKQKQNKKLPLNAIFVDNVYNVAVDVYVGPNSDCSVLITKKYNIPNPLDKNAAFAEAVFVERDGNFIVILWFSGYNLYNIVHECFHATEFVMHNIGSKLCDETQEQYAYYIEWLTKQVNELLIKELKICK